MAHALRQSQCGGVCCVRVLDNFIYHLLGNSNDILLGLHQQIRIDTINIAYS